ALPVSTNKMVASPVCKDKMVALPVSTDRMAASPTSTDKMAAPPASTDKMAALPVPPELLGSTEVPPTRVYLLIYFLKILMSFIFHHMLHIIYFFHNCLNHCLNAYKGQNPALFIVIIVSYNYN
ncbi:MAG: hypothetical protein ACRCZO_05110, partial [Cetobacterium sp.]